MEKTGNTKDKIKSSKESREDNSSSKSGTDKEAHDSLITNIGYRLLAENVRDYAIIILDPNGFISSWNIGAERIKGYKAEEILGKHFSTFYTQKAIKENHPQTELKIAREKGSYAEEGWRVRKDGSLFWASVLITALFDDNGVLLGYGKLTRDLTESKKAEQRLQTQYMVTKVLVEAQSVEEAGEKIIETISANINYDFSALWLIDPHANVLYCDHEWHTANDIDLDEFAELTKQLTFSLGEGLPGLVWQTKNPKWIDDIGHEPNFPRAAKAISSGLKSCFCVPIKLKNKIIGALEFYSKQKQRCDAELLKTIYALAMQIGVFLQRKEIESKLRVSELYNSAIFESASNSIITCDERGNIISFNPQTVKTFGFGASEIRNKNLDLMITDLSIQLDKLVWKPASEFTAKRKNGEIFTVEVNISEIKITQDKTYVVFIYDVTERKKAEKAKDEFISVVSHELRTPLTSILGSISLLLSGKIGEISERVKKLLVIANNNCERLIRLINDILDIEKIEAGKMALFFKRVDLNKLIQDTISATQMYAAQYNTSVIFESHEQAHLFVLADEDRLAQVLTNLISNAVKFSMAGGKVKVSLLKKGQYVRIAVTDYGQGISIEFQKRIFEKFSQAHTHSDRQRSGTGLGLAISKAIVEKHGGQLQFSTQENKGTTFYFDLPLSHDAPSEEIHLQKYRAGISNRILICEDDEEQAVFLRNLLERNNYRCDIALSAREALSFIKLNHYCLLLLDIILPDKDGISLIKELRGTEYAADLPIIVLSIIANESKELINGDAIEVVDWLEKPVDINKLLKLISLVERKLADKSLPTILHVEDDEETQKIVGAMLQDKAEVVFTSTIKESKVTLTQSSFDLVILDLNLPDGNGVELLPLLAKYCIPIVVFARSELDDKYAQYVKEILVKSKTSPQQLMSTVEILLAKTPP